MSTIVIVLIVLLLLGLFAAPTWPYSRGYGWYPAGGIGLVIIIVLVLFLLGVFPHA